MKRILKIFGVLFLLSILYFRLSIYPQLDLISGFSAKSTASSYFIDNRPIEIIEHEDNDIPKVNWATNSVNRTKSWASSSVFGLKERKAIYRKGLGAVLINDDFNITQVFETPRRSFKNHHLPFPYGSEEAAYKHFSNINYVKLDSIVAHAFDKKGEKEKRTRAVLVVYKDKIIAEKYADNITKNSRLLGWSMTKSITATYFGILQKQGKIDIMKPAPIKEWQNDKRKNITINNLLQMNSGLAWEEDYTKISDVTKMLFQAEDMTSAQINKPMIGKPNESWKYSSGTTNVLSGILRQQFKTHQEYLDFWYASLIDKIGMHSAVIETDMAGNFAGSSYGWATTRDWAKFGLLYLHKGNWNGEQIFDPSWAKYVATPTNTSNGQYGAQFWLDANGKYPDVPKDMYYCSGYQGQMIFIFPSLDLVVVRMGLSEDFDFNGFLKEVIECLK